MRKTRHMSILTIKTQKTFSFNQGVFFGLGTPFCSKRVTCLYSLLRPEKTFSFNQGVFFEVGTPFCAKSVTCLYSLLRPEKTFSFNQCLVLSYIFYSALLLGVFGLRRDLNSKTKVQSPISKLLAWTL